MAVDLTLARTLALAVVAGLLLANLPAAALGPAHPFAPPLAASAAAATEAAASQPAAMLNSGDGLAGVRSGTVPMALIDGQWWPVGGQPRGARLLSINRAGATLRHPDGRVEQLTLLPAAEPTAKATLR